MGEAKIYAPGSLSSTMEPWRTQSYVVDILGQISPNYYRFDAEKTAFVPRQELCRHFVDREMIDIVSELCKMGISHCVDEDCSIFLQNQRS